MQPVTLALCVARLDDQGQCQTPSTGLRHPSLAMLGVWASADYFKCPRCFGDGLHFLLQPVTLALCVSLLEGQCAASLSADCDWLNAGYRCFGDGLHLFSLHAVCMAVCGQDGRHWGARVSQGLERPGLVIERSWVRIPVGAAENFLLQGQLSVLTLISVSVTPQR